MRHLSRITGIFPKLMAENRTQSIAAGLIVCGVLLFGCTQDVLQDSNNEGNNQANPETETGTTTDGYTSDGYTHDVDARDETGLSGWRGDKLDGPLPNRCSPHSAVRDILPGGPLGVEWPPSIPYTHLHAGNSDSGTVQATYEGVVTLEDPIKFDCPPLAGSLGLNCTTDRALSFTESGDSNRLHRFAIGLSLDTIDLPSPGTPVTIDYGSIDQQSVPYENNRQQGLRIRENEGNQLVLAILEVMGAPERENAVEKFDHDIAGAHLTLSTDITDASTAHCLMAQRCPRLFRVEPLELQTSSSQSLAPGSNGDFETNGTSYNFWHLYTLRRSYDKTEGWSVGFCADSMPPIANFAIARQN